ncbi:MAG: darcynin family protein [Dermatophilaceae bacterium]
MADGDRCGQRAARVTLFSSSSATRQWWSHSGSKFWSTYFEVVEILPAIENAYATHYEEAPYGAGRSATTPA